MFSRAKRFNYPKPEECPKSECARCLRNHKASCNRTNNSKLISVTPKNSVGLKNVTPAHNTAKKNLIKCYDKSESKVVKNVQLQDSGVIVTPISSDEGNFSSEPSPSTFTRREEHFHHCGITSSDEGNVSSPEPPSSFSSATFTRRRESPDVNLILNSRENVDEYSEEIRVHNSVTSRSESSTPTSSVDDGHNPQARSSSKHFPSQFLESVERNIEEQREILHDLRSELASGRLDFSSTPSNFEISFYRRIIALENMSSVPLGEILDFLNVYSSHQRDSLQNMQRSQLFESLCSNIMLKVSSNVNDADVKNSNWKNVKKFFRNVLKPFKIASKK